MKHAVLCAILFATAMPAFAQGKPPCVDASDNNRYNARPIGPHEVLAKNAFGHDLRAARLATTCIHIYRDSFISLHSMTSCISLGDEVFARTIDGHGERCRVTGVKPATESYADAKYAD